MKSLKFASAVAALTMSLSGFALAVPGDAGNRDMPQARDDHGRNGHDERGRPDFDARRAPPPRETYARGAHDWHRGDRLPSEYRGRQYVVDDWRGHHLSAPPRGYQWVQAGPDYVLAAIATGVIANILLNQ
jgi:Ni/Co efflux regulator RcnB